MSLHRTLNQSEGHVAHSLEYADATARTGASGLTSVDIGRLARQLDDGSFWILLDDSPLTWNEIADPSGTGITDSSHKALRQLIHFIDNGPAESFASGAYRETTGTVFPIAIIWYDQSGSSKKKIVSKEIVWSGPFPATITWKMYDSSEVLVATITDTLTYSSPFETSRLRTIS